MTATGLCGSAISSSKNAQTLSEAQEPPAHTAMLHTFTKGTGIALMHRGSTGLTGPMTVQESSRQLCWHGRMTSSAHANYVEGSPYVISLLRMSVGGCPPSIAMLTPHHIGYDPTPSPSPLHDLGKTPAPQLANIGLRSPSSWQPGTGTGPTASVCLPTHVIGHTGPLMVTPDVPRLRRIVQNCEVRD